MSDRLGERVLSLERRLAGIQADIDAAAARQAMAVAPSGFRIGRIIGDPQDSDNTFDVIFDDGSYPQIAGQQTATYTGRQLAPRTVVHNLASVKIPVGNRVPCWWWSDRWWTWYSTSESTPTESPVRMMGFDDFWQSDLRYFLPGETRVFPWHSGDLKGNISGVTWHASGNDPYPDDTDEYFIIYPGTYRMDWGFSGYGGTNYGTADPNTTLKVGNLLTMQMKLQHKPVPIDGDPQETWSDVTGTFNSLWSYGSPAGMWNAASRSCILEISGDDLVCERYRFVAMSSTLTSAPTLDASIFYGHWHFTEIET